MKTIESQVTPIAPPDQARRVDEYRRLALERRAPAQVVYHESSALCPWPGCGYRIDGIHFQLESWADQILREKLLTAWWTSGLLGKCPKCQQWVLFDITSKAAVTDVKPYHMAMLPENWQEKAHIVTKPESVCGKK